MEGSIPVVTIDYVHHNCTAVCSNNIQGIEDLVRHIYSKGHRKIAYIHGQSDAYVTKERLASFYRTMESLGLEVPDEYIETADYIEITKSAACTKKLLGLQNPPTCILYPDDTALLGGMNVIKQMELQIPNDISIAGYDGSRMSQLLYPSITTIKQDAERIGVEAAKRLIGNIEKPKIALVERVIIEGMLLQGQSVANLEENQ
jgi:LacI family transcriptional regulator